MRYLFDLTTCAHWGGAAVGIVRVERELARRARRHLGDTLAFCLYDRFRNRILTIDDDVAADIIAGRRQVDFTPVLALRRIADARKELRRLALANVAVYHAIQRVRGRRFTRADVERIQAAERGANRLPIAQVPHRVATLDRDTMVISGGLDWDLKNVSALRSLKQRHGFRYCAVVHDIIGILFPHFVVPDLVDTLRTYFADLVWLADDTMCNSQATQRDWLAYCAGFGVAMPTHIFPLGSDLPAAEPSAEDRIPDALDGKRFALFVSTIEPRKNHRVLYEAWDRGIRSKALDPARDRLVFVGRRGWATDDLVREMTTNPATRDTIVMLNQVSDALLDTLYHGCALVLFPSFYEGYGLPVAEALSHGKPCISSDTGSLPEIGGDLVRRLDPKDTIAWSDAIASALTSPDELAAWAARIKANYRPVTWDDAAARFFNTIATIAP